MPDSGRKDLIPMKRPLAYITAPWSENEFENTENAAKYCRAVYDAGFSPVCPTLFLPLFLRDEIPQEHRRVCAVHKITDGGLRYAASHIKLILRHAPLLHQLNQTPADGFIQLQVPDLPSL